ncbi:MAG: hypothetical protein NNA20_11720 [Nitrospira sp.]|nr:hypothetical protein [Nitrospira sp.]
MSILEERIRTCSRCGGFMVPVRFDGSEELTGDWFGTSGWCCVNCGERIDPLILENRRASLLNS